MSLTPTAIAESIGTSWAAYLARQARPPSPHRHVYASAWRVCERRMAYDCLQPEALPPWSPEQLAKFQRGDDRERDLLVDLTRIGRDADPPFRVIGQQERFELKDHHSRVAIVGKVDAQLEIAGARAPVEVKSWSPFLVDKLETFADVFEQPWTQSGGYQLLAYLYGAGVPFGFLLLDRSGLPRLLPVELEAHLDRMEAFLARAERVLDHLQAGTLPGYLENDAAECRRCPWFGAVCNPPLGAHAATVLTDPELEAALERREQLQAAGKEYNALDADLKKRLRGIESGVIGHFQICGTWGKTSHLELPAALKQQYTVTNPKGRFTLEITRL